MLPFFSLLQSCPLQWPRFSFLPSFRVYIYPVSRIRNPRFTLMPSFIGHFSLFTLIYGLRIVWNYRPQMRCWEWTAGSVQAAGWTWRRLQFGWRGKIFVLSFVKCIAGAFLTFVFLWYFFFRIPWLFRLLSSVQEGITALMRAAKEGHAEVCRLLVEHGANSNAVDNVREGQRGDCIQSFNCVKDVTVVSQH